jgi:hypothetical protein
MLIYTAKVSKSKLAVVLLIAAALLGLVLCLAAQSSGSADGDSAIATQGATNEDRVACLEALGWTVSPEPLTSQEVKIPTEWTEVYSRYNDIQLSQGFDLEKYAGKTVKRYVYAVTNYPDTDGQVIATLLVYKDRIIGGDISSTAQDGFLHGLTLPTTDSDSTAEPSPTPTEAAA